MSNFKENKATVNQRMMHLNDIMKRRASKWYYWLEAYNGKYHVAKYRRSDDGRADVIATGTMRELALQLQVTINVLLDSTDLGNF